MDLYYTSHRLHSFSLNDMDKMIRPSIGGLKNMPSYRGMMSLRGLSSLSDR